MALISAGALEHLHTDKRYRLEEIEEPAAEEAISPFADPRAAASITLLKTWIAQAPTVPQAVREAEEDLLALKHNLNLSRKEVGARLHFPEIE